MLAQKEKVLLNGVFKNFKDDLSVNEIEIQFMEVKTEIILIQRIFLQMFNRSPELAIDLRDLESYNIIS